MLIHVKSMAFSGLYDKFRGIASGSQRGWVYSLIAALIL
jgi:hypothetical protein